MGGVDDFIRPSSPIWLSLAATMLLFTGRDVTAKPREFLQRAAGVPRVAEELATVLCQAELHAGEDQRREARSLLEHLAINPDQSWLPQSEATRALLLRATLLHTLLRKWPGDPHLRRYTAIAKNDLDLLRQRFDELALRISRSFGTMEHLGQIAQFLAKSGLSGEEHEAAATLIRKIVSDMLRDMCCDISEFCSHACLLVARGVLTTEHSARARDRAIARLGFRVRATAKATSYGILLIAAGLLYFSIAIFFALVGTPPQRISTPYLVLVITLIQLGALTVAIVPKNRWGFANAGLNTRSPLGFIVGAGVVACMLALAINAAAGALLIGGLDGSLKRVLDGAPYLISPFATAATTAWLVQDHRWRTISSPHTRRLLDAATMGIVWLIVSAFSTALRQSLTGASPDLDTLIWPMLGGSAIGGAIGGLVPARFRVNEADLRRHMTPFAMAATPEQEVPDTEVSIPRRAL
ncbi:hypothetical protein [Cupriavidus sp. AcVe19-6a]|uniref:hypothetical protein n=1 Tax=Cupriavidus sp. AcVe19-6a TaxID=2821358 RepID=UPI001AE53B20|nr:hypothetical protein [Cupriavidus sp. AcVe19-6a]MBP0639447.1 hypothetical protein [Cupriavidus sp. AcVe19-6a]